ncbi:amidohydrolase [Anoxynatronum sibiricum]|uniref:Amidohydrolase n=1 Tax=Anoxynatronum sibiricum TaxID=210623 RepID=A0ABU9VTS5_9CLOT
MDAIRQQIEALEEELIALRRDFHAHPEVGFEEHRTAAAVETYLGQLGVSTCRMAGTGVVGMIQGTKQEPVLMLRADMDALPVQEETGLLYQSQNEGVMHACAHDAHTAILLVAAKVLMQHREQLKGTIKLVFQPNEENAGALPMIEAGVLENPQVDAALGLHVWTPLKSGTVGLSSGGVMAGLDIFSITMRGAGGHTGYPETARDPVIAAADLIQTAQRIQTREISLMKPTVIMFGKISGGTKANIIPDTVTLEGSIRTLYDDREDRPVQRLRRLAEQVAATHGCTCEMTWFRENIPLINHPAMTRLMTETAARVMGGDTCLLPYASMASEDFSEFTARVPGAFAFLGAGDEEKKTHYPHHHPKFNIDESVLVKGVELLVKAAMAYFQAPARPVASDESGVENRL